jgi:predicted nuclease of predicted toxin-antitoxin system
LPCGNAELTPQDVGLLSATDTEQIEFAGREVRVIFTQDADFLRFHQSAVPHAGIVYCRQQARTIGDMVRRLAQLWENCDAKEMVNRLEYI